MASLLSIAEVAQRTGLSAHTLRYYERVGLIAPVARASGGQRRYAASDMDWIGFLLRLREARMPIGQMQAFAKLRAEGDATAAERRQLLQAHLADVLAAIKAMQRAAKALQDKIVHYRTVEAALPTASTPTERTHRAKHASRHAPDHAPNHPSKLGPLPPRARETARD